MHFLHDRRQHPRFIFPPSLRRFNERPLSIAYEALTAQQHICSFALHELSAMKTEVDHVREEVISTVKTDSEATYHEDGVQVDAALVTLQAVMARCSKTTIDAYQVAPYNRLSVGR